MEVLASCLCGQVRQLVTLEVTSLPAKVSLCHCLECRSTSGVLCTAYLALATPPTSLVDLSKYSSKSEFSRYFCSHCGSHVFAFHSPTSDWYVTSGVVEHDGDVIEVVQHDFVIETKDGGLASFFKHQPKPASEKAAGELDQLPMNVPHRQSSSDEVLISDTVPSDKLYAQCQCAGIKYFVTRPTMKSRNPSSPWPDLLVPYHSGSSVNQEDVKWWMQAGDTKYLAGLCACKSCRLAAGFPIQAWSFIPKANLENSDGSPMEYSKCGLEQYESSPGVFREFCRNCGASVFWHCNERPELVDVSVGLLRAQTGARAEGWLEWETKRVSFIEDAQDQTLMKALESGLQARKFE